MENEKRFGYHESTVQAGTPMTVQERCPQDHESFHYLEGYFNQNLLQIPFLILIHIS